MTVEFPCDLSSLAGCRDARLHPHDLIRKSWETAKLREETVSKLRVLFALFPPWHLYGSHLSEADICFLAYLCLPAALVLGKVWVHSAESLAHVGQLWISQGAHFLGKWALFLLEFSSLGTIHLNVKDREDTVEYSKKFLELVVTESQGNGIFRSP